MINVVHASIPTISIYDQCLPCICSDRLHIRTYVSYACAHHLSLKYKQLTFRLKPKFKLITIHKWT